VADATSRERHGDVVGAVQQHIRAIRLARSLANQTSSWNNWTACVRSEQAALENLRLLLGSADLSSVDLETVFNELLELLIFSKTNRHWQMLDPRIMLRRRMHFWGLAAYDDKTISDIRGESLDSDAFAGSMSTVSELEEQLKSMGSATRSRAFGTIYLSLLIQNTEWSGMNFGGRVGLADHYDASIEASIVSASQAVQRFAATSTIGDLNEDPTMISDRLDPRLFPATVNLIAEERATLVTVLLQRHRMIRGRFPDSLMELAEGDELISICLIDPWSGTPFFYAPKGLPKPIRLGFENEQYRISAGQPLLFSAGRFARPLHQYLQDPPRQEGEPYSVATLPPNLILFVGLDDRVQRFPLHNRVLEIKTSVASSAQGDVSASGDEPFGTMGGMSSEVDAPFPQPVQN
jgi:hypothetical protein